MRRRFDKTRAAALQTARAHDERFEQFLKEKRGNANGNASRNRESSLSSSSSSSSSTK